MRIITGLYKGRRLKTLEGLKVRPTSDRLRETLFNVLAPRIEGTSFLDLCAGSGAVGIEALSRGAGSATFVEASRKAAQIIQENLNHCGISEGATVIQKDVLAALRALEQEGARFDLVYFDPPYDTELYSPVIRHLARSGLIAEDGALIVEHRKQMPLAPNFGDLRPYRMIRQGESCLTFFAYEAAGTESNSFTEDN